MALKISGLTSNLGPWTFQRLKSEAYTPDLQDKVNLQLLRAPLALRPKARAQNETPNPK